jgi:hypothetical protein
MQTVTITCTGARMRVNSGAGSLKTNERMVCMQFIKRNGAISTLSLRPFVGVARLQAAFVSFIVCTSRFFAGLGLSTVTQFPVAARMQLFRSIVYVSACLVTDYCLIDRTPYS